MTSSKLRITSWMLGLTSAVLLAAGCGSQPASSVSEGPVGLSEPVSSAAAGSTGGSETASVSASVQAAATASQEPGTSVPEQKPMSASPDSNGTPPVPAVQPSLQPESAVRPVTAPVPAPLAAAAGTPETPQGSQDNMAVKEPPKDTAARDSNKPTAITFDELYANMTVRGVEISDAVQQLNGKKVEMIGFMAPPLTAKLKFFVLTRVALTICPFCSTDADWPTDIVVVNMPKGKETTPTQHQIKVTGTLSIGSQTDEETGFVSLIRINADKVEVLK